MCVVMNFSHVCETKRIEYNEVFRKQWSLSPNNNRNRSNCLGKISVNCSHASGLLITVLFISCQFSNVYQDLNKITDILVCLLYDLC